MWYSVKNDEGVWFPQLLLSGGTPGLLWFWTREECAQHCARLNSREA